MATFEIPDKDLLTSVDRASDSFLVYDASALSLERTTVNYALDITSHPVGVNDTQTLTAKTLTAPAISSPVLSGTVTGTYTLAGTPTFPSSVVTLTGSQTLTNKTLTAPTINNATIANPTLTVDTVSEYTSANGVTIDGLNIKDSKLNTNNSVVTSNITDGAVTVAKRSGGFYIGQIPAATVGSTGNKAITGVGFTPKLVRFSVGVTASTAIAAGSFGSMTTSAQYYSVFASDTAGTTLFSRVSGTTACFGWLSAGSSTPTLLASYVSMDSDGFTINVSTALGSFPINFEAYG